MMLKNKKAATGEAILMLYRIVLISFIALVILGIAAIFYDYELDVRNIEAEILAKKVIDCLAPSGELNLDSFPENRDDKLLDYCGIKNIERFYINVKVFSEQNQILKKFEQGDSGAGWVMEILKGVPTGSKFENLEKYRPGYLYSDYLLVIIESGNKIKGGIEIEVVVQHET